MDKEFREILLKQKEKTKKRIYELKSEFYRVQRAKESASMQLKQINELLRGATTTPPKKESPPQDDAKSSEDEEPEQSEEPKNEEHIPNAFTLT